jgi:hypothetical protein
MYDRAELVTAWAYGWATSRGTATPVPIAGGLRIDCGDSARYVLHELDRTVAAFSRDLTVPGTEIKVLSRTAALRSALGDDWSMYDPCHLMTRTLTYGPAEVRSPFAARIQQAGPTLIAAILDRDGDVVSSGRLAAAGRYGVIDQVWTRPTHQRRGLGTIVMAMLGNRAVDAGLTTGLLSATADGRALYSALLWTVVGELAGARRAKTISVSPGQSQNTPVDECDASSERTSSANAGARSPNRCGAAQENEK